MASEAQVQRDLWRELAGVSTLFRSNSGKGFLSNMGPSGVQWHTDGSVTIQAARPVGLGLALTSGDTVPGLTDLTGYTTVVITPEMVGRKVAVFTGMEVKRSKGGERKKHQVNYAMNVANAGGIAGFANSVEAGKELVLAWIENRAPRVL
jgi:hypothetical protein